MKRPAEAADCLGCPTGWTMGDLLCKRCANAVHAVQPTLYDRWITVRSAAQTDPEMVATEAYRRGLIVGTAQLISKQREAQQEAWRARKASTPNKNRRTWRHEITPLGEAVLNSGKQPQTTANNRQPSSTPQL